MPNLNIAYSTDDFVATKSSGTISTNQNGNGVKNYAK